MRKLANKRGAPITIPESFSSYVNREFETFYEAGAGFRLFYFALGSSAEISKTDDGRRSIDMEIVLNDDDVIPREDRKLFKLARSVNITRGATGRLYTA